MRHISRVLQVVAVMNQGGAENMIMNYYRAADKSKIQFDFLVHYPKRGFFDDEIEKMNIFGGAKSSIEKLSLTNVTEFDLLELLRGEKEFIGLYISGHPLDKYKEFIESYENIKIKKIKIKKAVRV